MTTPPETCPICGAGRKEEDFQFNNGTWSREYACGGEWRSQSRTDPQPHFNKPCPYAMTAALRTGATLTPGPLEVARDELVQRVGNWASVFDGMSTPAPVDYDLLGAYTAYHAFATGGEVIRANS